MITIHGDEFEIFVLADGCLQIWTKIKETGRISRVDCNSEGVITVLHQTNIEPSFYDPRLTDEELLDILEIIRQYLMKKRT